MTPLILPGDPEVAAKLLRDEGLRAMLIRNGLETVRKFTWDRVTDIFEEAIKG